MTFVSQNDVFQMANIAVLIENVAAAGLINQLANV